MNDTHDKMIEAFQNYFKWNDRFEYENSGEAGIKARYYLSIIHKMSSLRRKEIQAGRKEMYKTRNRKPGRPRKITT